MSAFTFLVDPLHTPVPAISYDKETSFLQHLFNTAGIVVPVETSFLQHLFNTAGIVMPVDVDLLSIVTTFRGQFPAILMKLRLSYEMFFPTHWNEAFMMESFSNWWFPSAPPPAATGQTSAPVVSHPPMSPVGSQCMYAFQRLCPLY